MAIFGNKATAALTGGAAFTMVVHQISGLNRNVAVADATPLAQSGGAKKKIISDRWDHGPVTIGIFYDPAQSFPPIGVSGTLSITSPDQGDILTGSGAIVDTTEGDYADDEISMGSIQFQFDGATGPTLSAAP